MADHLTMMKSCRL